MSCRTVTADSERRTKVLMMMNTKRMIWTAAPISMQISEEWQAKNEHKIWHEKSEEESREKKTEQVRIVRECTDRVVATKKTADGRATEDTTK